MPAELTLVVVTSGLVEENGVDDQIISQTLLFVNHLIGEALAERVYIHHFFTLTKGKHCHDGACDKKQLAFHISVGLISHLQK